MRVVVQYRAGHVPEAETGAQQQALWNWLDRLYERPEHTQTVVLGGGHTIGPQGTSEYAGDVFGLSILEVDSLETAADLLTEWPELPYGGHLDLLSELQP
ncbi:MAG TPA: hypothetical protein VK095_07145 [Beutenbergiaceae bacterium]|nr:hypothetical protein [Beutenbergiaceae bacterium]